MVSKMVAKFQKSPKYRSFKSNSSTLSVGGRTWLLTKVNSALWELPKLKKKMMMSTFSDLRTKKKMKKLNESRYCRKIQF